MARGRNRNFNNNIAIVNALAEVDTISRYLAIQLVKLGYLNIEKINSGKRGKPAHTFVLTGKAKGLLNLAKNWKNSNVKVAG